MKEIYIKDKSGGNCFFLCLSNNHPKHYSGRVVFGDNKTEHLRRSNPFARINMTIKSKTGRETIYTQRNEKYVPTTQKIKVNHLTNKITYKNNRNKKRIASHGHGQVQVPTDQRMSHCHTISREYLHIYICLLLFLSFLLKFLNPRIFPDFSNNHFLSLLRNRGVAPCPSHLCCDLF